MDLEITSHAKERMRKYKHPEDRGSYRKVRVYG